VLKDLESPPGNRLHSLYGDREGEYAISVNGPWRLCFRFEDGDIYDVELVQYH
jgi:proteic killer suppression protein